MRVFPAALAFPRFGVTISAKVAPKASDRNRLRRLAYDSVKRYYNEIPVADYWITALAEASKISKEKFVEGLKNLLS